jgi:hypothetical protein
VICGSRERKLETTLHVTGRLDDQARLLNGKAVGWGGKESGQFIIIPVQKNKKKNGGVMK